jgi:Ca2+-binding RTX toxin-like protein
MVTPQAARSGARAVRRALSVAALFFMVIVVVFGQADGVAAKNDDRKQPKVDVRVHRGTLTVTGTDGSDHITIGRSASNPNILEVDVLNGGRHSIDLRAKKVDSILVKLGAGDDSIRIDDSNGTFTDSLQTTLLGEDGDDTIIGGEGGETIHGGAGNDTLRGMGGNDHLEGGAGDDQVFGGDGHDYIVWNHGDGSDLIDGEGWVDVVEVNGSDDSETFTMTANGERVRFDRLSPAPFFLDIGTTEYFRLNAGGGDDYFSAVGNLAALISITVNGEHGNDTILGSNGIDTLDGGPGNDFIDGQQGNDFIVLGEGDDTFQWDPGDGSDVVEGRDGYDTMIFNGSNASEIYDVSANGSRIRFIRNVGNIVMDLAGVEKIETNMLGGEDLANVSTTVGTDLVAVSFTLSGVGGIDDGVADIVSVNGTAGNDTVELNSTPLGSAIHGLGAIVEVRAAGAGDALVFDGLGGHDTAVVNGSSAAETFTATSNGTRVRVDRTSPEPFAVDVVAEQLVINANGGDDSFFATGNLAALIAITVDGGDGNDTILGSNGADVLIGGPGDDVIDGQQGNDTVFLGEGDDTFVWDPGDGSDVVEGEGGYDIMVFNGSNANEIYDVLANGSRVRFTRNVGNIVMDVNQIERLNINTFSGTDVVNVHDLSGTHVVEVNVGITSPGEIDTVNVFGTAADDNFQVTGGVSGPVISRGGYIVNVLGAELGDVVVVDGLGGTDTVTVEGTAASEEFTVSSNGTRPRVDRLSPEPFAFELNAEHLVVNLGDGNDKIGAVGNLAALVHSTFNGGPGNDTIFGTNGPDVLIGGPGDDVIDGQQGNDTVFMGEGDDTFLWDPGDGNDIVEGEGGYDRFQLNGNAVAEIIDISANGSRVRLTRNIANIVHDLNGIERIDLPTAGGADAVSINDMTGTDLVEVNVNLAVSGAGDAQPDTVIVNATNNDDVVFIAGGPAGVQVLGLHVTLNITGAEAANDRLVVNALGGHDAVDATGVQAGAIQLTLDGGEGNDVLMGGDGDDVILGGPGDDVLIGGPGLDILDGGPGDNVVIQ